MYDSDINAFNFTTSDNNVTIKFCSSAKDKCKANNILSNERKSLWVSEQGVPQTIILNLTKMTWMKCLKRSMSVIMTFLQ